MTATVFPKLVLFDLDGTLLDSAPDMAATVNRMRAARGQAPMPLAELRPHVSKGSRAMSAAAFPELGGEVPAEMIREFLDTYEAELGKHSVLFDGVAELLNALELGDVDVARLRGDLDGPGGRHLGDFAVGCGGLRADVAGGRSLAAGQGRQGGDERGHENAAGNAGLKVTLHGGSPVKNELGRLRRGSVVQP